MGWIHADSDSEPWGGGHGAPFRCSICGKGYYSSCTPECVEEEKYRHTMLMEQFATTEAANKAIFAALVPIRPDDNRLIECYLPTDNIGGPPRRMSVVEYARRSGLDVRYAADGRGVDLPAGDDSWHIWKSRSVWLFASIVDAEKAEQEVRATERRKREENEKAVIMARWDAMRPIKKFELLLIKGHKVCARVEHTTFRVDRDGQLWKMDWETLSPVAGTTLANL